MSQPFTLRAVGILATALACGLVWSSAWAFDVPDGQSCGGLVCDLGLFGHKTMPKPAATASVPTVPTPATSVAEHPVTPPQEPHKVAVRRRTHVAKAVPVAPVERRPAAASLGTPPLAAALVPAPARLAPPPAAASPIAAVLEPVPPPAPMVPVTPPVRSEPTVLANPYVYSRPLPFMFQSVDPTQGVQ